MLRVLKENIETVLPQGSYMVIKLSSEYGLTEQTIYKWVKLYSPIDEDDNGVAVSMKEYKEFKKKMAQLSRHKSSWKCLPKYIK